MDITNLRKATQLGPFAMFDFAASYAVVSILWVIISIASSTWSGLLLIKMLLGVIPLSIFIHLFNSDGSKLNEKTKSTAMTDMFLDPCLNSFGSVAVKAVVIGSLAGIANL